MPKRSYQQYYDYLDELRDSGETNMFGARPYLMREFGLGDTEAQGILLEWMNGFSKRKQRTKG